MEVSVAVADSRVDDEASAVSDAVVKLSGSNCEDSKVSASKVSCVDDSVVSPSNVDGLGDSVVSASKINIGDSEVSASEV